MPSNPTISRRRLLQGIGAAGAAGAATMLPRLDAMSAVPGRVATRRAPGYQPWLWNDPRTWANGRVPGTGDIAVIDRPIVIEGDVSVAGVHIEASGALTFSPHAATTLLSSGNVVVKGRLVMRPQAADVNHTLRFVGVREDLYRGGHTHVPLSSDVGLWVIEQGLLDVQGADKLAWTRAADSLTAGQTTLRLEEHPTGWRPGDTLVITPTLPDSHLAFDVRRVQTLDGSLVTLDRPLEYAHPAFDHTPSGVYLTAEVLNLTRNARIEGTPQGRAHVQILHAQRSQHLGNLELAYMGPRHPADVGTDGVLGRYALHFHKSHDGTRGSTVEGVVAHDCGANAFVPHQSHGIAFHQCIAYNIGGSGFWWDPPGGVNKETPDDDHLTHDALYDRCVSALHWADPNSQARGLDAYLMVAGTGNRAIGCVAVGVQGATNAAGFDWPSRANHTDNVWVMEDCVSHNNAHNGVFVWQNDSNPHIIDGLVSYRNGRAGIEQGAYGNAYRYRNTVLAGNGYHRNRGAQLIQHSNARWNAETESMAGYDSVLFDALPDTIACVISERHKALGGGPLEWIDCTFVGGQHVLHIDERTGGHPGQLHFVRAKVGPAKRDIEPADIKISRNDNGTVVRAQRHDGTAWHMDADGRVSQIPPFYNR